MTPDLLTQLLEDRAEHVSLRAGSLAAVRRRAARRTARTRLAVGAAGVAVVGGVVAAVRLPGGSDQRVVPLATSDAHTSSPSITDPLQTIPTTAVAPLGTPLQKGMEGDDVLALEQALAEQGYDPGPIDGVFDDSTDQAVWAAEGLTLDRPYDEQTGMVDDAVWQALQGSTVKPRRPQTGTHVEIYLDLQVAVVFTNNEPNLITHISSGSGDAWCELARIDIRADGLPVDPPIEQDICGIARTPGGVFQISRIIEGTRQSSLGGMFNPVFFNYGIAIHGAVNVPSEPESHGAIRIPMHIAKYLPSLVRGGDTVLVWEGSTEPEDQSQAEMLPTFDFPNPAPTTTPAG